MAGEILLQNLINPEVIGSRLDLKLVDMIKFSPLARIGYDLQGTSGNTITVPFWSYIGDATVVAEATPIGLTTLSQSTAQATVIKAGKAVEISDESVLSGLGDVVSEAERQLGMSIAQKIDADCLTAMSGATQTQSGVFSKDVVADGLVKFGEDIDENTYLVINPTQYSILRKDDDFVHIGNGAVKVSGTVGQIFGCTVVVSNKLAGGTVSYLVREGALGIEMKRGVAVEADRDILKKTTVISADAHYVAYLRDDNNIVKLLGA